MKNLKSFIAYCSKLSLRGNEVTEAIPLQNGKSLGLLRFARNDRQFKIRLSSFLIRNFIFILTFTLSLAFFGCGGGKQSATQTTTVTTGNNSAPVISSVSASSSSVQIGAQVSLTCTASDNDGDTLSYSWAVSGGSLSSATASSTTWTVSNTTGNYTATCSVGDGKTNTSGSASITVSPASSSNNNPTISSITASSSSIAVAQTTTITVAASDSDGDVLGYSYSATGGTVSGTTSSATYTAPSSAGSYTVQVSVTDGKGGSATSSVSITVTSSTTTLIDDDFSTFSGWTYDTVVSSNGAGFMSDGNYLLANAWGSGFSGWNGPVVYKTFDPPLDLLNDTFTLDLYLIVAQNVSYQGTYFQFVDKDGTIIVEAGYHQEAYCCGTYRYFYVSILGNKVTKNQNSPINGKITLKASGGNFKILYLDVEQTSLSLTTSYQAVKLRMGMRDQTGGYLTNMKFDWLRLTKP